MVNQKLTDSQEKFEQFLQRLQAARQLQDDIIKYGTDAAHLYYDDVNGDWLEKWGEDDEEPGYVELMTNFLESDDLVAVKVRDKLEGKSISEIIEELELCLSQLEEVDRIRATKNLLASEVVSSGNNRGSSDIFNENNEIELLDLAESLLDKLTEILG